MSRARLDVRPVPASRCYRCNIDRENLAEHLCQVTPRPITARKAAETAVHHLLDDLDVPNGRGYSPAHAVLLDEVAQYAAWWADTIRSECAR